MKTIGLKKTFALMVTLLLTFWISGSGAAAQDRGGDKIEGTWLPQVTVRNCQTGSVIFAFQGLTTFLRGGEMFETANNTSPALRGPGHGFWRGSYGEGYTFSFISFRFNPDGTYAGIQRVKGAMKIGSNPNESTGTAFLEVFNPAGTLVGTGCVETTARRFE